MLDIPRFIINVDMDDTIVSFEEGFSKAFGKPWSDAQHSINNNPPTGWFEVKDKHPQFWAALDPLPGALNFWAAIAHNKEFEYATVNLLTAYPRIWSTLELPQEDYDWIEHGKVKWAVKHLEPLPKRIYICDRHQKADFAASWTVLIDDNVDTCHEFAAKGGYAIHFTGDYAEPLLEIQALYRAYMESFFAQKTA